MINAETVEELLIAPLSVFRSLTGLVFAISTIRALEVFEIETHQLIERMEHAEGVAVERERTARNLHDNTIQQLYAAGLLAQSLRLKNVPSSATATGLDRLMHIINDAIAGLRAFISGLAATQASTDPSSALQHLVEEARAAYGLDVRWRADSVPCFPEKSIGHLVAILRESLSNVARHAHAHSVEVELHHHNSRLNLTISDDGRGLPANVSRGYGMRDMIDRARLLGGKATFASSQQGGTIVMLDIPCEDDQ
jgi:signal transduction histidine kinase